MTMLTAAALWSVLQAAPTTGLMVLGRQGLPNDELKKALLTLDAELQRSGVEALTVEETSKRLKAVGAAEPSTCAGKVPCLAALGVKLEVPWLVSVSVTKLGRDRAWVLEAIEVASASAGAREEWLDEANADISEAAARFAGRLSKSMKPGDAPVAVKLDPAPTPPPVVVETPVAPPPSEKVLPKVLLAGAGVAVAGSVVLAIFAASTAGTLNRTREGPGGVRLSDFTTSEAQRLAGTANALTIAAIAAGAVAAGLGVGSVLSW